MQRVGEQREIPPVRVAGEDLHETGFEDESGLSRRLLDDRAQPLVRQRPQHQQMRLDQSGEAEVVGEIPEPICANRHHGRAAEHHAPEFVEELPSLLRVVVRECLLALVDDQQRLAVVLDDLAERLHGTLARRDHDHAPAARGEVRPDPGPDER